VGKREVDRWSVDRDLPYVPDREEPAHDYLEVVGGRR
jgi:hypothetical protein